LVGSQEDGNSTARTYNQNHAPQYTLVMNDLFISWTCVPRESNRMSTELDNELLTYD